MLNQLRELVERSPKQVTNILDSASKTCKSGQHEKHKQTYRDLHRWIYDATRNLDIYGCKTAQRIHWILNDLHDFPRCVECGKPICDPNRFKSI